MANVNFIPPAKSLAVSRSDSLPPRLISSPSMSLHCLPCQTSSPVRNRLILIHFVKHSSDIRQKCDHVVHVRVVYAHTRGSNA